jgi:NTE family protein/lysophospholipid hydrolase
LNSREVLRHYHVEAGNKGDFQRVARTLAGHSFGLVLGGGGARGLAHIGVIKALREFGLPIDRVGGTSSGAIAAAAVALRADVQTMREWQEALFNSFSDLTLPLLSVMKGEKFTRTLQKLFGETQIEDLPLDYFAIATNLTRAQMMVLRRGYLWRATRASASLPGVFPPLLEDNELLIDGAIFDNVPITTMQEFCEGGAVIAVNVEDMTVRKRSYQFDPAQSGWALLGSRILPWMKGRYKAPSMIGLMSRSTILSSIDQLNATKDQAEIYLNPPVGKFGTFEVKAADEMIQIAYEHTRERLTEWQQAQARKEGN